MKARRLDGKTETDVRVFVLSRKLSPQALLATHGESVPISLQMGWA